MKRSICGFLLLASAIGPLATAVAHEYLVKLQSQPTDFTAVHGGSLELVSAPGYLYLWKTDSAVNLASPHLRGVDYIQKNHRIQLIENPSITGQQDKIRQALTGLQIKQTRATDNPDFAKPGPEKAGKDPMLASSWGIDLIGANSAWTKLPKGQAVTVAVTDTGVDYNHADLIHNMWRNPGEIAGDGIDNDGNGYIDDMVGWDFFSNDNKPFDYTLSIFEILLSGGNPGHGTHVAGVIGGRLNNSLGTAGVAPEVKIMALRFISEKGQGDSAAAIKAIDYAVAMGAKIINASWGSEGEEEGDAALRESIERAEAKGVLFIAAAGNGRADATSQQPAGFNNDTDSKPMYPCSYPYENIVSVAAIDSSLNLATFSNYGAKSVDLGAPGVKILSTVPGNQYQDTIIDLGGMKVTWDGTSMASPFVAGAAAVIWSTDTSLSAKQVKEKLLAKTVAIPSVDGKVVSNGRLDLKGAF